ncbi:MAG: ammonium transporter [Candidatus Hydrogenedentes bacterium]|nr:ammonium transporter [Candidatus Hydrogenedentota bacterium]MBI3119339.1 ammonium transporter [Candidatus Hydrogenedentota bacterium]
MEEVSVYRATYSRFGSVFRRAAPWVLPALCVGAPALAQDAPTLDSGNTAWMLTATALVLFMTIPGLSLFYGGLVRSKNVLSVLMQCFAITALGSVLWAIIGYTLAFNAPEAQAGEAINLYSFIGGLDKLFLRGVTPDALSGTYPESIFVMFQMTFFIITPALICGAYAERMKFSAMMLFTGLWMLLVYAPICHMAWSGTGALFARWGVLDFAGGTVVHINAGIAALVACLLLGKRTGYPEKPMPPHNLGMSVTGAGMLWVGWFGFNAGSELAADGVAGNAMLVTQLATAMATLTWMAIEWVKHGKPSVLGAITGAVAGLVAITPASGTAGAMGALAIGAAAATGCFFAATTLKRSLGYDDSLDAFGVHGVGGMIGALLTGVFCSPDLGGLGFNAAHTDIAGQVMAQAMSVCTTLVWSGVVSFIILKVVDLAVGIRVDAEKESTGLDLTGHNEEGYNLEAV